jgi:hypothetical protein
LGWFCPKIGVHQCLHLHPVRAASPSERDGLVQAQVSVVNFDL